jgi:hypothetical protein
LLLFCGEDLQVYADRVADEADDGGHESVEAIASKFVAQITTEFRGDHASDYLKLAQLLDPRVSHRTKSRDEVKRLLNKLKVYCPETTAVQNENDDDDEMDEAYDAVSSDEEEEQTAFDRDIHYLRNTALRSIRKRVTDEKGDEYWEYFGGKTRPEDIDVFAFYQYHGPFMPFIDPVIQQMLSQPSASYCPETIFSRAKFIINDYRQALTPERAEQLILSATRYRMNMRGKKLPGLPQLGVDPSDEEIEENMEEVLDAGSNIFEGSDSDESDCDGDDDIFT